MSVAANLALTPSDLSQRRARVLLFALLVGLAACGDDGGEEAPIDDEPIVEPSDPVTLSQAQRGLVFNAYDAQYLATVPDLSAAVGVVGLRSQTRDEFAYFEAFAMGDGQALQGALFASHVAELRAEVEATGAFTDPRYALIFDPLRLSDGASGHPTPYLTTWLENRIDIDRYGFWRGDYREALLEQLEAAAQAQQPAYVIVGAEMERYLTMEGGADDYANFITFYREAYARIKAVSPSTKVGAGVDWVRFQLDVAPSQTITTLDLPARYRREELAAAEVEDGVYVEPATISCAAPSGDADYVQAVSRACTDQAFAIYIEPLLRYLDPQQPTAPEDAPEDFVVTPTYVQTADILALSALPQASDFGGDPANTPEDLFGYLRLWSLDFPVVYYNVGWQTSSDVGGPQQASWLETMLTRNAGVSVELVMWSALADFGTGGGRKNCSLLMGPDIGAPPWYCFQGLLSVSGNRKPSHDVFLSDGPFD